MGGIPGGMYVAESQDSSVINPIAYSAVTSISYNDADGSTLPDSRCDVRDVAERAVFVVLYYRTGTRSTPWRSTRQPSTRRTDTAQNMVHVKHSFRHLDCNTCHLSHQRRPPINHKAVSDHLMRQLQART